MSSQSFVLISSPWGGGGGGGGLRGLRFLSAHFAKIAIKHKLVTPLYQYLAQLKVHSRAKFAMNLINIQGVMSVYSRKKNETFVIAAV